jgi:arylsulfatase A
MRKQMKRVVWIYRVLVLAVLFSATSYRLFAQTNTAAESQPQSPIANSRPNIVLLYADDLGWGDLSCQNPDSKISTPHLDELAQNGSRFIDAHSSSGVCTPSRYALLTGQYHWRKFHGIVNSFEQPVFDAEQETLAELLKRSGYRTACFGKWHLGWDWRAIQSQPLQRPDPKLGYAANDFDWSRPIPGGPCDHGFDVYFGDDVPNFPPYAWIENDRILGPPTTRLDNRQQTAEGSFETRPGPAVDDWDFYAVMPQVTDRAIAWLEQQTTEQPFFLYFPFTSPHAPIVPAERFRGQSAAGGYGDYVIQTDAIVGEVIATLRQQGLLENTIIIFSADNGPETYAYERIRQFNHRSMGPLRGLKRDLWEGGHRVPLIVSWPGKIPAGRVEEGLISQIDLYATIASWVGTSITAGNAIDSFDQRELMSGTGPSQRRELVHNTNPNGYALRQDDWVLIAAKSGGISAVPEWLARQEHYEASDSAFELYQLSVDLGQRQNVASQYPQRVEAMTTRLAELKSAGQVR